MGTTGLGTTMKIDESRCTRCKKVERNMHGAPYPDEWYLNNEGELVCEECYDATLVGHSRLEQVYLARHQKDE